MKKGLINLLREPMRPEIKLNKRLFVFLVCLLISFFSWLQINLSKVQTENIPVKVLFANLPKTRFGVAKLSDTLSVEVEADGYDLLKYEMKEVQIDFRKLKKNRNPESYIFLPNMFTKTIGKELGENFKVVRALTDTIQLNPPLK